MTIVEMAKNLAPEVKEKALKCKTAEELLTLAKENNLDLTEEQANEILKATNNGELSDDDLDSVAGGISVALIISACAAAISTGVPCPADVCGGQIGK